MNIALWIVQALLTLIFLWASGIKLVLPIEELTKQMPMPGWFLRFIAVCEVFGAIGLILPGLLGIRPGLTPLAAAGLVVIMLGATVLTLMTGDITIALIPLVVGLLSTFVAYGRWRRSAGRLTRQCSRLSPILHQDCCAGEKRFRFFGETIGSSSRNS